MRRPTRHPPAPPPVPPRGPAPAWQAASLLLLVAGCSQSSLGWRGSEAEVARQARTLAGYKRVHEVALGTRIVRELGTDELIAALRSQRILWLGDQHVDVSIHQEYRELLHRLREAGFRMVLALEAIGVADEGTIAGYLRGEFDMAGLREQMRDRWPGSWLEPGDVDANFYRALLADARAAQEPVAGLEATPRPPLAERDAAIAARVASLARRWPDRLIVVVVGQAHLCGPGRVVELTGLGGTILVQELGARLGRARSALRPARLTTWLESDSGVLFPTWAR